MILHYDPPGENPLGDTEGDPEPPPEACDFCGKKAHLRACPELLAYTNQVKADMKARTSLDTVSNVIAGIVRFCPTCNTPMERCGRAWVCPKQRDEEKAISQSLRLSIRANATARQPELAPF